MQKDDEPDKEPEVELNLIDKKTLSKVYRGILKPENSDDEQYWTNGITFVSTASDG